MLFPRLLYFRTEGSSRSVSPNRAFKGQWTACIDIFYVDVKINLREVNLGIMHAIAETRFLTVLNLALNAQSCTPMRCLAHFDRHCSNMVMVH